MRVAVTGTNGQVGNALAQSLEADGHAVFEMTRTAADITDRATVLNFFEQHEPELVIHPAAYTYVDQAETEPDAAYTVNALGTQNLALACQKHNAALLYVSTNCVFDGHKPYPETYREYDAPNPTSVYGRSKLAGEWYAQNLLQKFYIARVSWVYGTKRGEGKPNFIEKMLQIADERGAVSVVDDEWSNPTYADDLAAALIQLGQTEAYGVYHLVNEGVTSRYEYAAEIFRQAGRDVPMTRVKLADFKRATPPLPNTGLTNFAAASLGIKLRPWQDALSDFMQRKGLTKP